MHFYLIRHGQSYVNLSDWAGHLDAGLTELGKRQAAALAAWLPQLSLIHISEPTRPY